MNKGRTSLPCVELRGSSHQPPPNMDARLSCGKRRRGQERKRTIFWGCPRVSRRRPSSLCVRARASHASKPSRSRHPACSALKPPCLPFQLPLGFRRRVEKPLLTLPARPQQPL